MKKNDIITLEITALSNGGDGIGHHGGMAVFVPGTAAGDICEIIVIKVLSNRAIGKLKTLLTPSPDRTENLCPAFPACGGCQFRHLSYRAELDSKLTSVRDAVSRIGGITPPPDLRILGADKTSEYRNKALYPLVPTPSGAEYGFYRSGTHSVVPCLRGGAHVPCLLHPAEFETAVSVVVGWMNENGIPAYCEANGSGTVRAVYLRRAETSGELMVCLVSAKKHLSGTESLVPALLRAGIGFSTLVINHNPDRTNTVLGKNSAVLYGPGTVTDKLCGIKLCISHQSFYQVNRTQCEKLYSAAIGFAQSAVSLKDAKLLDLYCGVGSIALAFSGLCLKVFGIEIVPSAIENAKKNAALNGIENAFFECGDAASAPAILSKHSFSPDIVTVDPPRKGLSSDVLNFLKRCTAKYLIYISCEPTTFARDAKLLSDTFSVTKMCAVDMFPRTANTETVCLLSKKQNGSVY